MNQENRKQQESRKKADLTTEDTEGHRDSQREESTSQTTNDTSCANGERLMIGEERLTINDHPSHPTGGD